MLLPRKYFFSRTFMLKKVHPSFVLLKLIGMIFPIAKFGILNDTRFLIDYFFSGTVLFT